MNNGNDIHDVLDVRGVGLVWAEDAYVGDWSDLVVVGVALDHFCSDVLQRVRGAGWVFNPAYEGGIEWDGRGWCRRRHVIVRLVDRAPVAKGDAK